MPVESNGFAAQAAYYKALAKQAFAENRLILAAHLEAIAYSFDAVLGEIENEVKS